MKKAVESDKWHSAITNNIELLIFAHLYFVAYLSVIRADQQSNIEYWEGELVIGNAMGHPLTFNGVFQILYVM